MCRGTLDADCPPRGGRHRSRWQRRKLAGQCGGRWERGDGSPRPVPGPTEGGRPPEAGRSEDVQEGGRHHGRLQNLWRALGRCLSPSHSPGSMWQGDAKLSWDPPGLGIPTVPQERRVRRRLYQKLGQKRGAACIMHMVPSGRWGRGETPSRPRPWTGELRQFPLSSPPLTWQRSAILWLPQLQEKAKPLQSGPSDLQPSSGQRC